MFIFESGESSEYYDEIIKDGKLELIKKFETPYTWIEIYKIP